MTAPNTRELGAQIAEVRAQMAMQRALWHAQTAAEALVPSTFPRSRTMSLLVKHPGLGIGVAAAGLGALWLLSERDRAGLVLPLVKSAIRFGALFASDRT